MTFKCSGMAVSGNEEIVSHSAFYHFLFERLLLKWIKSLTFVRGLRAMHFLFQDRSAF